MMSDEEDEDLLREVNSPHNELDPNEEEAFLDAYALQFPQSGLMPGSPQLATIESASPSFRQNEPPKKTLEALDNDRVGRHLRLVTMERSKILSTQSGHTSHVFSNLVEPQLAPLTPGAQLPTTQDTRLSGPSIGTGALSLRVRPVVSSLLPQL
jgi:hypothetical protein